MISAWVGATEAVGGTGAPDRVVRQMFIDHDRHARLTGAGGDADFGCHGTDQPTPRSSCAVSNNGRPTTLEWLPERKRMKLAPRPWMA